MKNIAEQFHKIYLLNPCYEGVLVRRSVAPSPLLIGKKGSKCLTTVGNNQRQQI